MSLVDDLNELVAAGVVPVLHHTPLRPEYVDLEDPADPEPRWCCHDARDHTYHSHGENPVEPVQNLLLWARSGLLPNPNRFPRT